jgi:hypothetical protein
MEQLDLFYTLKAATASRCVDPDGRVCTDDEIAETIRLGDHNTGLRIEPARHGELWMWGTSFSTSTGGSSYRVGPKWGKFAESRGDAVLQACDEIRKRAAGHSGGAKVVQLLNNWQKGQVQ